MISPGLLETVQEHAQRTVVCATFAQNLTSCSFGLRAKMKISRKTSFPLAPRYIHFNRKTFNCFTRRCFSLL